jgi:hypothetical protein
VRHGDLEADEGVQVARGAFISGHTSAFHTATAASSRSIAWRTGTWQVQPCRRISFQVPSTVSPTWNSLPISVLIRPSVQRWSPAKPCASGPRRSSASSRAHCCGPSFSRDRSASSPQSRQARCHRRTDPSMTRRSCAIWPIARRGRTARLLPTAASHAAAARRACTRPVAHTAYPGHTPATTRRHDPISTSSTWYPVTSFQAALRQQSRISALI